MSLSFPTLSLPTCLTWNYGKHSKYQTTTNYPQSLRHPASSTLQKSVIYELELTYDFLGNAGRTYSDDLAYVQEFYEGCRGSYGWFLFNPSQYKLEPMVITSDVTKLRNGYFGTGDGSTTVFPLWRSTSALGLSTPTPCELIQQVTNLGGIYVNGTLLAGSQYTLSNLPAQIAFATPPASGAVLSWAGNYAYLCKFSEDVLEIDEFMYQLWELKSLKLETIIL